MGRQIIVSNLSRDVKRSDLKEVFSKYGKIVDVWKHEREATIVRIGFGYFLDWIDSHSLDYRILTSRNSILRGR